MNQEPEQNSTCLRKCSNLVVHPHTDRNKIRTAKACFFVVCTGYLANCLCFCSWHSSRPYSLLQKFVTFCWRDYKQLEMAFKDIFRLNILLDIFLCRKLPNSHEEGRIKNMDPRSMDHPFGPPHLYLNSIRFTSRKIFRPKGKVILPLIWKIKAGVHH